MNRYENKLNFIDLTIEYVTFNQFYSIVAIFRRLDVNISHFHQYIYS